MSASIRSPGCCWRSWQSAPGRARARQQGQQRAEQRDAWTLVCRLFARGEPALRAAMACGDSAILPALGRAVRPATVSARAVLCPVCQLHGARVLSDGRGGRIAKCQDCGQVAVRPDDVAAVALDEDWFHEKLRQALRIDSRERVHDLGGEVWRLGDMRRSPVLLARDLGRVLREPALLDRVRVAGSDVRVITPAPHETRGAPFGRGVQWLALEERFTLEGAGIAYIPPGEAPEPLPADPAAPVHGPFSADFRWVTLPGEERPIRCTPSQAAVFEALWSFKGAPRTREEVMRVAGQDSPKPGDVFKGPRYLEARRVFKALVVTQERLGLYAMPCAATLATA